MRCHELIWELIPDLPTVCLRFSETTRKGEGTQRAVERRERDTRDRRKEEKVITLLATVQTNSFFKLTTKKENSSHYFQNASLIYTEETMIGVNFICSRYTWNQWKGTGEIFLHRKGLISLYPFGLWAICNIHTVTSHHQSWRAHCGEPSLLTLYHTNSYRPDWDLL